VTSRTRAAGALGVALLLACGEPAPTGGGAAPEGSAQAPLSPAAAQVERRGERFTLRLSGTPAGEALDRLAAAGSFTVVEGEDEAGWRERPLDLDLGGVSLPRALHAVLADVPHHLHYEWEDEIGPGGPPWPAAPVRLARVTIGAVYRPPPWRRAGGRGPRTSPSRDPGDGLEDRDPEVRARAAARLDPDGPGLETLASVLRDDPSPAVRRTAARALAGGRGLHTYPILLQSLDDRDPEVVVAVIEALEDAYDDHPVPEIRERVAEAVLHRDARIRAAARDFVEWVEE